jgi:hypothetical protein
MDDGMIYWYISLFIINEKIVYGWMGFARHISVVEFTPGGGK